MVAPDDGVELSYAQLQLAVSSMAAQLRSRWNVDAGHRVCIFIPNGADFVITYLAVMYLGAVACPVNTALQDTEIEYIVANSKASVICVFSDWCERVRKIVSNAGLSTSVVETQKLALGGDGTAPGGASALPESRPEDIALIVHTSGSTGHPKGVMLTHRNLLLDCQYIVDVLGLQESDRAFCVLPLFHTNAEVLSVLCPLFTGGSVVIPRQFHASQFWPLARDHSVTWCSAAPTIFYILVKRSEQEAVPDHAGHRVRLFVSGTSALPVPLMEEFELTFGAPILEGYGLTETVCRVAFNRIAGRRFGSVGTPIGDSRIEIVDDDDKLLPESERGEIVLRGSVIMKGYFNDERATAEAFRNDWFHTGDIGYKDSDGFVYIVDRKKDMIIRGGQNIYPREVDRVLAMHPKIEDAAVAGVPDEKYGQEVKAYVVCKSGAILSTDEIVSFCRQQLAAYKCPKTVQFIDAMPKGPTGKLLRAQLLARYENNAPQAERIS